MSWIDKDAVESRATEDKAVFLRNILCDTIPELRDTPASSVGLHQTRKIEWTLAYLRVKAKAEEAPDATYRVLDVGADPLFACLLMSIPNVHVTLHRTWVDADTFGSIVKSPRSQLSWAGMLFKYRDRLRILLCEPSGETARPEYDCVTNISVMEHLPDAQWKIWSEWSWDSLKCGGDYLLTMDWPYYNRIGEAGGGEHGMTRRPMPGLVRGMTAPWEEDYPEDLPRIKDMFFPTEVKDWHNRVEEEFLVWVGFMQKDES